MFAFPREVARALCAAILITLLLPTVAAAQVLFVDGVVVDQTGHPVPGATVRISGQNITLSSTTDATGHFGFTTLTVGTYRLTVSKGGMQTSESIDVSSAGVTLRISLTALTTIGRVVTSNRATQKSGTDVTIDATQLAHLPTGSSLPTILTQLPSAAQGSNGQVHVNGDHNGLNYYLDGVQVPADLNRVLGTEIDPSDIGYLDVLEGAYPAQYGDKFAAVLNIGTKAYAGPAGYVFSAAGGSYNTYESSLSVHTPVGAGGGSLSIAAFGSRNSWGLDPPVGDPVHNGSSDANAFLRLSLPVAGGDTLNFDAVHSLQSFQIPPDTANRVPPETDDDEFQSDTFVALQYRHAIGENGSLQFGPSLKVSNILDANDRADDLAAGGAPPPPGGINCVDFTDCVFSVYANRTARDYRFNADYALKSAHHTIRAGALYDATSILKNYVITLQPFSAKNPTGAFTAIDTAPNTAHQQEAYLQDSWAIGNKYLLDYGLRMDAFQIFSTNFDQGFSQFSPRIKLTRFFGPRLSVYVYYGRLFVPFSFENVNPVTAAALYYAPPPDAFDLRPQRDSLYEIGAHAPLGPADLGIRIMHNVSTNWLDDTQVGATNLHQDINFPIGRVDAQSLYVQENLRGGGRAYASVTHSIALNSVVCETNLLQNCTLGGYLSGTGNALIPYYVSPGGGLVQADHDQHWDANAGWLVYDTHGGWFSINGEYGSGLSLGDAGVISAGPPPYAYAADPDCITNDAVNCKVPPHIVINVEKGVSVGPHVNLALSVLNVFQDRYAITIDSSLQGTHFARPRTILLRFSATSP
jgi:hypothetical protein